MWKTVDAGLLNHVASDHSPKAEAVKLATDNILEATYGGIGGVGTMLPLMYGIGFEAGRIDIDTLARLTSTNAAKVYGLYPRKGTIKPGSDADLVVIPKDGDMRQFIPQNLHGPADYSLYQSLSSSGFPRDVIRSGAVVVRDGALTDKGPTGRYLARLGEA